MGKFRIGLLHPSFIVEEAITLEKALLVALHMGYIDLGKLLELDLMLVRCTSL